MGSTLIIIDHSTDRVLRKSKTARPVLCYHSDTQTQRHVSSEMDISVTWNVPSIVLFWLFCFSFCFVLEAVL